jgi:hypothetical protein
MLRGRLTRLNHFRFRLRKCVYYIYVDYLDTEGLQVLYPCLHFIVVMGCVI